MEGTEEKKSRSALAITGLVLGVLALLTSLVPIVNNVSFFVGLLGVVFAAAGVVACVRGKRSGKGMAIAAVIVNVVAIVAVLGSQSLYSAAIDDAMKGPEATATSSSDSKESDKAEEAPSVHELEVGASVELENGLVVTLDSVETGIANYDGSPLTCIHVTYKNNGEKAADFDSYDWKGESPEGTQRDNTYYSESDQDLSSGSIAAGGTAAGNVYFDGDIAKVLYFSNIFADEPAATWILSR